MTYCVFMHRSDSIYDDSPAEQYQFPMQYRGRAKGGIGDWIVYLEPSKIAGTRGHFAIARVQEIIPDPKAPDMYLALIEPGSYLDFVCSVRFNDENGPMERGPMERGLLNEHGKLFGRAQSAVRPISLQDFQRIIERDLADDKPLLPRIGAPEPVIGFDESQEFYLFEQPRDRVQQLTSRIVHDRVFRKIVLRAYDERCAITGLRLINGSGAPKWMLRISVWFRQMGRMS